METGVLMVVNKPVTWKSTDKDSLDFGVDFVVKMYSSRA
jgi:hypothetical protein